MAAEYIFTRHGQSVVNLTRVISNRVTDSTPLVEQIVRKHRGDAGSVVLVSHGSLLVNLLPEILTNIDSAYTHSLPFHNCACVTAAEVGSKLMYLEWCGSPWDEARAGGNGTITNLV